MLNVEIHHVLMCTAVNVIIIEPLNVSRWRGGQPRFHVLFCYVPTSMPPLPHQPGDI